MLLSRQDCKESTFSASHVAIVAHAVKTVMHVAQVTDDCGETVK